MRIRPSALVALMLLAVTLAGASNDRPAFPDVRFTDLDGREVSITSYRGAVVLLNFWATWCGPCRVELPELQKLSGELGGKGLVVLAVAVDTPPSRVRPYLERLGVTLPAVVMDARTQRALGIDRIPFSILLDRESRVVKIYSGYSPEIMDDLRRRAELLVSSPAGKPEGS